MISKYRKPRTGLPYNMKKYQHGTLTNYVHGKCRCEKCVQVHREWHLAYYHQRRLELIALLGSKCVDCGTLEDLEFDHIDSSTKEFSVGKLLNYSKKKIAEEVKKCALRCNPCHEEKSLREGDVLPRATHGMDSMYKHSKCRCEECKEAHRVAGRKYREQAKKKS